MCGDGTVDGNEACDDGNGADGDGCSETCTIETPVAACGNGTRENAEACDDGNTASGDGCSSSCALEAACGDDKVDVGEQCDDGNTTSGDGCSATCKTEAAASCTLFPQSGCSGAKPACDFDEDGDHICRAVTVQGTSNNHCDALTECKAGYTCVAEQGGAAGEAVCVRFCEDDADCTGTGSRCVLALEGPSGPIADGCSNACDPYGQTGCPTGMACIPYTASAGDFTDCRYVGTAWPDEACTESTDCEAGAMCVVSGGTKTCQSICVVGNSNTCDWNHDCTAFADPLVIGGVEYGACK